MLGEVWESALECGEGKGEMWGKVWRNVLGVWENMLGFGGRSREVLGEGWGSVLGYGGGEGKCVGVWGR